MKNGISFNYEHRHQITAGTVSSVDNTLRLLEIYQKIIYIPYFEIMLVIRPLQNLT